MGAFNFIKRIDGLICPLIVFLFKRKKDIESDNAKIKKILLIKFGNIGDAIITIPAIRALRKKFPKTRIVMITSNRTKGLYHQCLYIDDVIKSSLIENKGFIKNIFLTFINVIRLIKTVKKGEFDLAIDLESYSTFSAFLAFISGAKIRLGIDIEGSKRASLFTNKIPYFKKDRHELDMFLDLISLIGIKTKNKSLEISKRDDEYISLFLKQNNISKKDTIVALHPGGNSDWMIKRWPRENFIELINQLSKRYKVQIVLVGTPDEKDVAKEIALTSKEKLINSVGKTNINQLATLISKCDLFIGNDSAPMHIAAAVRTPVVAIMNYVNPKRWGPYGNSNIAITSASSDNPYWNGYVGNPNQIKEPALAEVELVMKAVEKQIESIKNG